MEDIVDNFDSDAENQMDIEIGEVQIQHNEENYQQNVYNTAI